MQEVVLKIKDFIFVYCFNLYHFHNYEVLSIKSNRDLFQFHNPSFFQLKSAGFYQIFQSVIWRFLQFCDRTGDKRGFTLPSDKSKVSCQCLTLVVTPHKHVVSDVQTQISADTTRFLRRNARHSPSLRYAAGDRRRAAAGGPETLSSESNGDAFEQKHKRDKSDGLNLGRGAVEQAADRRDSRRTKSRWGLEGVAHSDSPQLPPVDQRKWNHLHTSSAPEDFITLRMT